MTNTIMYNDSDISTILDGMGQQLSQLISQRAIEAPIIVGIRTGGIWIAEALHQRLMLEKAIGTLDISFYRDDFSHYGLNPTVHPSQLPEDIADQHIILIDDVLMSGRTIRAALNELFDYGRPKSVILATLIDLSANELPIQADVTGIKVSLKSNQRVKLRGPSPLQIELKEIE